MKILAALVVLVTSGALVLGSGTGCGCTQVDCSSAVTTTLTAPGDLEALEGAVVTVCRSGICEDAVLVLSTPNVLTCTFDAGHACLITTDGEETKIEITYAFGSDDEPDDDEVFRFQVAVGDGDVLDEAEGEPDFDEYEPNGEWCSPTCYNATL
jgi:hypothetical protein